MVDTETENEVFITDSTEPQDYDMTGTDNTPEPPEHDCSVKSESQTGDVTENHMATILEAQSTYLSNDTGDEPHIVAELDIAHPTDIDAPKLEENEKLNKSLLTDAIHPSDIINMINTAEKAGNDPTLRYWMNVERTMD